MSGDEWEWKMLAGEFVLHLIRRDDTGRVELRCNIKPPGRYRMTTRFKSSTRCALCKAGRTRGEPGDVA